MGSGCFCYLCQGVFCRLVFFFFQAEDGIRDLTVTGVQTCALPILAKKRIKREAELFTLPRHYVHGIMEKKRSNFAGRFRHENARVRLVAHQYRERSDVILMRMSDKNGVECLALDRLPIWQRILTRIFGMHPAIENQPPASRLEIVRVRADLRMTGEIDELNAAALLLIVLS